MNRRISLLGLLIVAVLTAIAFTAGGGAAQTTGSSTAGTGTGTVPATAAATATTAATVAPTVAPTVAATATRPTATAVATGTGGGATVPVTPTTGQARSGSVNFVLIEGLVLGVAVAGTGLMLRRRATRR